jgi:hypothetical protein
MTTPEYWLISSEGFLTAMKRAAAGEDPDMLYIEFYSNSDAEEMTLSPTTDLPTEDE